MALAQENTSSFQAGFLLDSPAEDPNVNRDSGVSIRPARREKHARRTETSTGKLARAVRVLRVAEDEIGTTLAAAERALRTLEAGRMYEDAGFGSFEDFEQRMLHPTPLLQAMRAALPAPPCPPRRKAARTADVRARKTKALDSIARALANFRSLDEKLRSKVEKAKTMLTDIEAERLYEECGYISFEDFLERALGPSPILAESIVLLDALPAAAVEDPSPPSSEAPQYEPPVDPSGAPPALLDGAKDDATPLFFEAPAENASDGTTENAPDPIVEPTSTRSAQTPARRGPILALTVCLALAAAVLGAAAGINTNRAESVATPAAAAAPIPSGSKTH
jgi:hypothetical protein